MNKRARVNAALKSAMVIIIATIVLVYQGVSSVGVAQAQANESQGGGTSFSWQYQLDFTSPSRQSAEGQASAVNLSLMSKGVSSNLLALGNSSYRLAMAGHEGIEQLREVLYSPLVGAFIGGPVEFEISMPVDELDETTLKLESNLTTGYQWRLVPDEGNPFAQVGGSTFRSRSAGYGTPSVQTIILAPQSTRGGTIRLEYGRSFEPDEPATRHLHVDFAVQTTEIDLSDPEPTILKSEAVSDQASTISDPIAAIPANKGLPAAFDWRSSGIVPDVRDQGGCGSCWAFGTVSVMESAVKKGGGPLTDLSEQFLVSCNNDGWDCDGGWTATKYHYNTLGKSQSQVGAVLEADKPYTATNGTCTVSYTHPYQASNWAFITSSESTMATVDQIKNAMYTYGPVTAGVCVDSGWSSYSGGVYDTPSNVCGGYTNHQIVLVGWDDATSSWILRNSWGPSWGESGYMRIRWDTTGTTSRVGEGTSWVEYTGTVSTAPTPKTPSGRIGDTTPTYKWTPVSGATQYQYELMKGTTLIYRKAAPSSVCTASACTTTPGIRLQPAAYQWRVRAMVGGIWKNYSGPKPFTVAETPKVKAPTGTITDQTPTYQWTRLIGAAAYRYEVTKGGISVYAPVILADACPGTVCEHTPATSLKAGNYQWRVQAKINGAWKAYSPYKGFQIQVASTKPLAGYWASTTGDEFYVTSSQTYVDDFAVYFTACGSSWKVTHTPLVPIASNHFSFSGPFYASGTFASSTVASGTDGLYQFYLPGCGYVNGGPWSYTATWRSVSVPLETTVREANIFEVIQETLFGNGRTVQVERIDP